MDEAGLALRVLLGAVASCSSSRARTRPTFTWLALPPDAGDRGSHVSGRRSRPGAQAIAGREPRIGRAGECAGLLLARLGVAAMLRIDRHAIPRLVETTIDGRVLAVVVGMSVLTALAFGLAPVSRYGKRNRTMP